MSERKPVALTDLAGLLASDLFNAEMVRALMLVLVRNEVVRGEEIIANLALTLGQARAAPDTAPFAGVFAQMISDLRDDLLGTQQMH